MPDAVVVAAAIAAVPATIGGGMGAWAAVKQRGTDQLTLTVKAMSDHMKTLSDENGSLRTRVTHAEDRTHSAEERAYAAESKANEALVKLAECERERQALQVDVEDLKRRADESEQRDADRHG